jgi:hypothetical protein
MLWPHLNLGSTPKKLQREPGSPAKKAEQGRFWQTRNDNLSKRTRHYRAASRFARIMIFSLFGRFLPPLGSVTAMKNDCFITHVAGDLSIGKYQTDC